MPAVIKHKHYLDGWYYTGAKEQLEWYQKTYPDKKFSLVHSAAPFPIRDEYWLSDYLRNET